MISKQLGMKLSALTLALMLAGCGGGGSDGYYNNDGASGNNGGSTGNGSNPDAQQAPVNITEITLLDNENNSTNVVTPDGVMALVQVTNEKGEGIPNSIVRFTGE